MPLTSLYLASWEKTAGTSWVARHGLTSAQYQTAFDDFVPQGFRLRTVSGHAIGSTVRYAAIWEKAAGPAWTARHGMSATQYQTAFDQLVGQGHRLRMVNAFNVGPNASFAAIWDKSAGPAWVARHGLSGAQYQAAFDQFVAQGHRLRWVVTYLELGNIRYAALWDQSAGPAWVARHGRDEAAFRADCHSFAAQGYDLVCGNAVSVGGADFYAALWEKRPVASVTHHGMTSGTYQQKFDQLVGQGYRPAFVAGYAGDDPIDVVLPFAMQAQTQGNWCWAAVSASVARFFTPATTWTQCRVANAQIGRTDCCGTGASGPCNIYGFLDDALNRVGHFDRMTSSISSFATVESEVLAGRPHGIRVAWSGGGAHFVAATGTEDDGSVWVSDPGGGTTSLVDYEILKTKYSGSGAWTHSYFIRS